MTEDKICPIMSQCHVDTHGDHITAFAHCQGERCMFWAPEEIEVRKGEPTMAGPRGEDHTFRCAAHCKMVEHGFWKLL